MRVLFCGNHFSGGYVYTKEAVARRLVGIGLDPAEIEVLQCERENVPTEIKSATVVIPLMTKITSELIESAPNLRMVMQFGVGVEGVDIPFASSKGIFVCNICSENCGNAQSCAEHSIYLATAILRNVNELKRSIALGRLGYPLGKTLYQSRSMIIGFGGIGRQLLPRLLAMGAQHVTVVSRSATDVDVADERVSFNDFSKMFGTDRDLQTEKFQYDIVFLCCNVNADNIGMVNTSFLSRFEPGLHIVNVARVGCSS